VLVISAVLVYVAVRTFQPTEALALQQAERLRNDLRRMQTLATTWGQALRLTVGANGYSISCVTASALPPCNASPVLDPATRNPYLVNLEPGLTLSGPTLDIDPLGRPGGAATFTIAGGGVPRTVIVTAITGFATAQ
jgi:hypothetical protein